MAEVKRKTYVEIPIFLYFFSSNLSVPVFSNLLIYQTCYVTLGYNQSDCALLGTENKNIITSALEKMVQPHAAMIIMTRFIIESLFTSVLCLFLGPWSDKFGRKPILISSLIGTTMNYTVIAIISTIQFSSPWLYLLASIPSIASGGLASFLTVALCCISDTTTKRNRGLRMGLLDASLGLGMLVGMMSSSYIFAAMNYLGLFSICAASMLVAVIYTAVFIPESVGAVEREVNHLKSLFEFKSVKDIIRTTFKQRENNARAILLICLTMLTVFVIVIVGESSVLFLFLRQKFGWSLHQFTLYSGSSNAISAVGPLVGLYLLHKKLQVPETVLILMGFLSMLNGSIQLYLATKDWQIYFAAVLRCFGGVINPMIRSIISKLVPLDEVGKVFSLAVALEMLSGLIGSPLYTTVYNETFDKSPEFFNIDSAALLSWNILLIVGVMLHARCYGSVFFQRINDNDETDGMDETDET